MKRILAVAAMSLALSGCMAMHGGHGGHGKPTKAVCPVCGSTVKIKKDTPSMTWKGKQLYFASAEHQKRFAEAPDSVKAPEQAPASGSHEGH